jgi:hypothetical protein
LFSGIAAAVLFVSGMIGVLANGFPGRYEFSLGAYTADNKVLQEESMAILKSISKPHGVDEYEHDHLWFSPGDPRRKILLVGNSHSKDLFNVFWFSESVRNVFQIARYGCQIKELNSRAAPIFSSPNYRAADIIIIVSSFSEEDVQALPAVLENLSKDKKTVAVVQNIFAFPVFGNFTLADKDIFAFMRTHPDFRNRMSQLETEVNESYFKAYSEGIARKGAQDTNQRIRSAAQERNMPVLDRMDYECDRANALCYGVNSDIEKLFYDYGHHTLAGARFFAKRLDSLKWLGVLSSSADVGAQ